MCMSTICRKRNQKTVHMHEPPSSTLIHVKEGFPVSDSLMSPYHVTYCVLSTQSAGT